MSTRDLVVCRNCSEVYVARRRADGTYLLPNESGDCRCGSAKFRVVEDASPSEAD